MILLSKYSKNDFTMNMDWWFYNEIYWLWFCHKKSNRDYFTVKMHWKWFHFWIYWKGYSDFLCYPITDTRKKKVRNDLFIYRPPFNTHWHIDTDTQTHRNTHIHTHTHTHMKMLFAITAGFDNMYTLTHVSLHAWLGLCTHLESWYQPTIMRNFLTR